MGRMANRRRWLQFSLRTAFVVLTLFAVWLGWWVERARDKRDAVQAVLAIGGRINYAYGPRKKGFTLSEVRDMQAKWQRTAWLRLSFGEDFLYNIDTVNLRQCRYSDREILKLIPQLQRLQPLRAVRLSRTIDVDTQRQLAAALPDCKVMR